MRVFSQIQFFTAVLTALLLCGSGHEVRAQTSAQCGFSPEVIVTLRDPQFGIPTVWDSAFEDENDGMAEFAAGLPLQDGTLMAAGEILSGKDFKPAERVLVQMNRRHRVMMERRHPAALNEKAADIMALNKGFVIASTFSGPRKERRVKLSWYDAKATFKKEKIFKDSDYDYTAYDLDHAVSGNRIMLLVQAVNRKNPEDQYGVLMQLSADGKLLWRRAYRPGIPNLLDGITPLAGKEDYLAYGRIRMEDGRDAAWLIELNHDGTIVWQRTYPRGKASILRDAQPAKGGFILTGESEPLDDKGGAGWVMKVMNLGIPVWQSYYRAKDYALDGVGSIVFEDGRIAVALNAQALEGTFGRNHIRMLTLNPRGVMMQDQAYIEGRMAAARQFLEGNKDERIAIANITALPHLAERKDRVKLSISGPGEMGPALPLESETAKKSEETGALPRLQGWFLVATPLDPYQDPCEVPAIQGAP